MDRAEMSKRVMLTLPDKIYQQLEDWAGEEGRPVANLAAFLVETAIREKNKSLAQKDDH